MSGELIRKKQSERLVLADMSTNKPPICLLHLLIQIVYYSALFTLPNHGSIGLCRHHFIDNFYASSSLMLVLMTILEIEKALRVFDADLTLRSYTDFYDESVIVKCNRLFSVLKALFAFFVGFVE